MGRFVKGDVVVIPFPFSDLSGSKKRPALVIATLDGDDVILCQINSRTFRDKYTIELNSRSLSEGSLVQPISSIRPNRLFTADSAIIFRKVATIDTNTTDKVINVILQLIV